MARGKRGFKLKKLHQIIEKHWQNPNPILQMMLSPWSRIFARIVAKRRAHFLSGSLKTQKLPVPVVVVGNIHAGGTGKTPITAALVRGLQARGVRVGVVSRGYGRKSREIIVLHENHTADEVGDEPLMLFRQTAVPMAVGADRYAAGMALLVAQPDLQVIVLDDGLQHYRLARDVEICVFPATDVGRDDLDVLPNGGLREMPSRLQDVDFIVITHSVDVPKVCANLPTQKPIFHSQIQLGKPYRLNNPQEILHSGSLKTGETCAAVAAIARPERFFNSLKQLGFLLSETRILPDHAAIDWADLPRADYVFITEKDAVKLPKNAPNHVWVLPIVANVLPDLAAAVWQKLQNKCA